MKKLDYKERNKTESLLMISAIVFVAIFLGILVFEYLTVTNNSIMVNYDTKLDGEVSKISVHRGQVFILLKGEEKYWIIDNSYNFNYEPSFLGDILINGDFVKKSSCSDTLLILRNNSKYMFLIGDALLNSKEHSVEWVNHWRKQRRIIKEKGNCIN